MRGWDIRRSDRHVWWQLPFRYAIIDQAVKSQVLLMAVLEAKLRPCTALVLGFPSETLNLAKVVPAVRQQAYAEVFVQLCLTFPCKESAYIKMLQGKTSSAQWGNFKIYFTILSARWLLRHCRGLANLKLYSFATIECRSYQMCLQRFSRIKFFDLHMSFSFCCFLFPTVFALDKL